MHNGRTQALLGLSVKCTFLSISMDKSALGCFPTFPINHNRFSSDGKQFKINSGCRKKCKILTVKLLPDSKGLISYKQPTCLRAQKVEVRGPGNKKAPVLTQLCESEGACRGSEPSFGFVASLLLA